MNATTFTIQGPLLIEPKSFFDDRGFFTERFHADRFKELGINNTFVQDNYSVSKPGVLRGLHYQFSPPQGKLVTCVSGRIFDVAVDIRANSQTFGKWISAELDAKTPKWLWLPAGFAHGFCVLGDQPASVLYKVDCYWSKDGENGICWDDKDLNIHWPEQNIQLSDKDQKLQSFAEYRKQPRF